MMKTGKYSMEPATLALPDPARYSSRWFQGIPGIEILPDGRIVVLFVGVEPEDILVGSEIGKLTLCVVSRAPFQKLDGVLIGRFSVKI